MPRVIKQLVLGHSCGSKQSLNGLGGRSGPALDHHTYPPPPLWTVWRPQHQLHNTQPCAGVTGTCLSELDSFQGYWENYLSTVKLTNVSLHGTNSAELLLSGPIATLFCPSWPWLQTQPLLVPSARGDALPSPGGTGTAA